MSTGDKFIDTKEKTVSFVKSRVFDFIAVGIVIAMAALSLGIVELRTITLKELLNIVLECIPFYFAATLLSANYYNKGVFVAKQTDKFISTIAYYSNKVSSLTGEQLKLLPVFCDEYNSKALKDSRTKLLRTVAITYEEFDEGVNGEPPLKCLSKRKLKSKYEHHIVKVILECKKMRIKGIYPNVLLSNFMNTDITDLGSTEKELSKKRLASYAGMYVVSIFIMSLMAVKDVLQWGWMGAALTLFKVLYISIGAYMKYFNGYEDISTFVVNHINRKSDVIKEYEYWYSQYKKNLEVVSMTEPENA